MRHVYVAFLEGTKVLIVRRREVSTWWGRGPSEPRIVDAAGQWALPGGGFESVGSPLAALQRLFCEQTGIAFPDGRSAEPWRPTSRSFMLYFIPVTGLEPLASSISLRTAPSAVTPGRPAGGSIVNWELSSAHIVPLAKVVAHLGVRQPVSHENQLAITRQAMRSPTSQSIERYATMAAIIALQ
ncbi:NUDIX domain-containing protein [Azospirillum isscasi]|uniref:NUDIX domain-containing protein n=1 Tax=Azospirillum isscasi TaxID=3053926 RepID=A0ABU0WE69_9PROT|nr:NUDIX domain-containing protein [Azospirillum isscasi]MDQ2102492.1 NUDIX domain-containing protein [Azospirillum isscasi]